MHELKNQDMKYFKDQKVRKKSLRTKNKIMKNYKHNLLI
jgi:hypothetical protein